MENYSYPTEQFAKGYQFKIRHCDGVVIFEQVYKVVNDGFTILYVCESCACYTQDEILTAHENGDQNLPVDFNCTLK